MPAIGMMINVITATELVIMRAIVVVIAGNVVLGRVHLAVIRMNVAVILNQEVVLPVIEDVVIDVKGAALLAVATVVEEAVSAINAVVAKKTLVTANLVMIMIGSVHPLEIGSVELQKAPVETATGTSRSSSVTSGTSRNIRLARKGSHKTERKQLEKIGSNATLMLRKVETSRTLAAKKSTSQLPKEIKKQGYLEDEAASGTSPVTQRMIVYGCE